METPKFVCPFKKTIINDKNQIASYLRWTSKNLNIEVKELRYLIYKETFGPVIEKENFSKLYLQDQYSLPDFFEKHGIGYKITLFLIEYHELKKRNHSESGKISAKKTKETFLKKYGVDHTFKVKEFDEKRKKTYIEKYGVDNPFKVKNFLQNVESSYQEKYGCSLRERKSIKSKEAWASKTPEEKAEWVSKSLRSEESLENNKQTYVSGIEKRIQVILFNNNISFVSQYKVGGFLFDLYLPKFNILLEINGTIWHADPDIYDPDDIMPVSNKKASEIWEKDARKIALAKEKKYTVITLWEKEIKFLNDQELYELIYFKIKEIYENKVN